MCARTAHRVVTEKYDGQRSVLSFVLSFVQQKWEAA
jgi:hypothetical protein